jgi:hypothetical protein
MIGKDRVQDHALSQIPGQLSLRGAGPRNAPGLVGWRVMFNTVRRTPHEHGDQAQRTPKTPRRAPKLLRFALPGNRDAHR